REVVVGDGDPRLLLRACGRGALGSRGQRISGRGGRRRSKRRGRRSRSCGRRIRAEGSQGEGCQNGGGCDGKRFHGGSPMGFNVTLPPDISSHLDFTP